MAGNGLWVNPTTYVPVAPEQNPLSREIASRARSLDFTSLAMYLPDPDPVLRKLGQDLRVYRELACDSHVFACIQSRKSGVLSMLWEIDRGKAPSKQTKIIEGVFKGLDLNRIMAEILDCVLWGFQPLEIYWELRDSLLLPSDIKGKPSEWFVFSPENQLRFRSRNNMLEGEALPDQKFLCPAYQGSYANPYGERTLSRVFWPVTFKKGSLKFWVKFTEKYGTPFLIGKHPRGAQDAEIQKLLDALEVMGSDAVGAFPDDSRIEILEAGGKAASADIFEKLLNSCNEEISKAILGQTLTTQVGEKGSYAASNTHMQVRADLIHADRKIVEQTLNQLISWIWELNWGVSGGGKPVFSMWPEEDVDLDLATRDKTLSDAGLKLTRQYYQRAYGFEDGDIAEDQPATTQPGLAFAEGCLENLAYMQLLMDRMPDQVQKDLQKKYPSMSADRIHDTIDRALYEMKFSSPGFRDLSGGFKRLMNQDEARGIEHAFPCAAFAEGKIPAPDAQDEIDAFADSFTDEQLQTQMEPILKPVIDMLQNCASYAEAMEKLAGMYPQMDSRQLEKSLEKAAYLAEVYGGVEAQNA